jgi:MFS family permease
MQYAYGAVLVVFLVERGGVSVVDAGLVLSAAMVTSIIARIAWGYVADRMRPDIVLAGLGLITAGAVAASVLVDESWSRIALGALGCWFGASGFSWNGVYLALTADIAGHARVTTATSGVMTLVFIGSLAFPAFYSGMIAWSGYDAGLLTLAAVNAVTGVYVFIGLRAKG